MLVFGEKIGMRAGDLDVYLQGPGDFSFGSANVSKVSLTKCKVGKSCCFSRRNSSLNNLTLPVSLHVFAHAKLSDWGG